jgi:serine/threonine-protein kinase ATR
MFADLLSYASVYTSGRKPSSAYIPTMETLREASRQEYGAQAVTKIHVQGTPSILLSVGRLCPAVMKYHQNTSSPQTPEAQLSELSWVVECLASLWSLWPTNGQTASPVWQSTLRVVLFAVQAILNSLASVHSDIVLCARMAVLACRIISTGFASLCSGQFDDLDKPVAWSLAAFLALGFRYPPVMQSYAVHLALTIENLVTDSAILKGLSSDVQRALVLASQLVNHEGTSIPSELLDFDDTLLKDKFVTLIDTVKISIHQRNDEKDRPSKRLRQSSSHDVSSLAGFDRAYLDLQIFAVLNIEQNDEPDSLAVTIDRFADCSEDEQCKIFEILGNSACKSAQDTQKFVKCGSCEGWEHQTKAQRSLMDSELADQIYETFAKLLASTKDTKAPRPRIAALLALRRLLAHSGNTKHFDTKTQPLGQWCITSLRSSVRDVRLASTNTLRFFVEDGLDQDTAGRNRPAALDALRTQAEKNEASLLETCILGFGQIVTCVTSEEEVSIALNRLVEFLGHGNPLICGFANEELLRICKYDAYQAQQLFEPYWRTIAVRIVQNLQKRPQIAHSVCEILGIHVGELLRRTQFHTIPHLVLTKQRDALQKIASASGADQTVFSICISRAQLAAILSKLLLNSPEDVNQFVSDHLIEATRDFENHELAELLKTNSIFTAFELLKSAGEPDQTIKLRAAQVLEYLAETTQRKPGSSKNSSYRRQDVVASFFETWALAIVQLLSDVIGQAKGPHSTLERKRCVGAIEEMAKLAKSQISHALPQITSCLRTAIEDPLLCNEALSAWMTLLTTLDEEFIKGLVDPTFAILAQHWDSFNTTTHKRSYDVLEVLWRNHGGLVQDIVKTIPSIASVPLLSKFSNDMERMKTGLEPKRQLEVYGKRCKNENDTVVLRALNELEDFLADNQSYLQKAAMREQPDQVIGEIIRALLDACVRFKDINSDIALRCARCLGLIGCIDPTKIDCLRDDPEIFVLSNFGIGDETVDFIIFFLREVLVKAYIATTVTSRQQMLAFGMQELLTICDFEKSVTQRKGDEVYRKWISMPESTRNILTPFLTSKYLINPSTVQNDKKYPLYRPGMDFMHWLRTFTLDLLRKGRGVNARLVFDICIRLVRNQDIAIASFLLPYAMLNVIAEGSEQDRADVVLELFTVLAQAQNDLDHTGRESLISCSQVSTRRLFDRCMLTFARMCSKL